MDIGHIVTEEAWKAFAAVLLGTVATWCWRKCKAAAGFSKRLVSAVDLVPQIAAGQAELRQGQLQNVVRLHMLAADTPDGKFEADINGNNTWVNRTFLRMTGRTSDEVLGKGWSIIVCEDERERVVEEWNRAVRDRRDFEMSYTVTCIRGEDFVVHTRALPQRMPDGEVVGYVGSMTRDTLSDAIAKRLTPTNGNGASHENH